MVLFELLVVLTVTAALTVVSCRLLTPFAHLVGLLDHPSCRKVHRGDVPLVGGVGAFLAFCVMITVVGVPGHETLCLLGACALLVVVGIVDDLRSLSPIVRFSGQALGCLLMISLCDVVLTDFGSLMWNGVLSLGWLSIPITIFSALGVINAFNMMDGIDGLSSTVFIIAASAMAWLAWLAGMDGNFSTLLVAIATVFGFFILNARVSWNRKFRVFLGEAGTGFLGLLLAWQFIDLGNGADRSFAPITAVWIFGVPLVDTLCVMARRWRRGTSMVAADQLHLHHAFLRAGFTIRQTWMAITILLLCTAGVGLLGHFLRVPEYVMFYAYMVFGSSYCFVMNRCWQHGRFLGRDIDLSSNPCE